MQSMACQSYKVKVDMISEREWLMSSEQLARKEWFPNYLIVRKPVQSGSGFAGALIGEWQGILREIQKSLRLQVEGVKGDMKKNNMKIENEINHIRSEITEIMEIINKAETIKRM